MGPTETRPLKRVALAGTHGAGKTTLVELLAPELGLAALTKSLTTEVALAMGYTRASLVPSHRLQEFQWLGLVTQARVEAAAGAFISHRSPIDYLAYWAYQVPPERREAGYGNVCLFLASKLDVIVHLPMPTWALEDNGVRHLGGQEAVAENIAAFLRSEALHTPVIDVTSEGLENRKVEVLEKLQALGFTWGGKP